MQQQTAECRLGSGARGTVVASAEWFRLVAGSAARRGVDSGDSKVRSIGMGIPYAHNDTVRLALDFRVGVCDGARLMRSVRQYASFTYVNER